MRRTAGFPAVAVWALGALALPVGAIADDAGPQTPPPERSTLQLLQAGITALGADDFHRARARFREATEIDPRLAPAHLGLGLAALGELDRKGSERALRRALDLSGGLPEVRYALGIARFVFYGPRAAVSDLEDVIKADPAFLEARYALGMATFRRGDLPRAADALREAILIDVTRAAPHFLLGAVLARAGDHDGALWELSQGLAADPGLLNPRPEDRLLFIRRANASMRSFVGGPPMPLPMVRPSLAIPGRSTPRRRFSRATAIPEWYLAYAVALRLEDAGRWREAAGLMERALAVKDRPERLAVVADRLVDYLPHFHLAKIYHRMRSFREAALHLGLARSEEQASRDTLRALRLLVDKDRQRPLIILEPLPDRTTAEWVAIRGAVISDEAVQRVEVAGREALLRSGTRVDLETLLPEEELPATIGDRKILLFEIPEHGLGLGSNLITIRPFFRTPERDGDLLEASVVRLAPAGPGEAGTPVVPAPGGGP